MIFDPADPADPVNAGVERDDLWAGSTTGVSMRVVHYIDPVTNESFQFITSLTDSKKHPPGVIAMLYHMRWDIEKVFDDVKNKLHETKAWASSGGSSNDNLRSSTESAMKRSKSEKPNG